MQLPVIHPPPTAHPGSSPDADQLDALASEVARAMSGRVRGEVRTHRHDRMLYATDASMYQVEPIAVVVPADAADLCTALEVCDSLGLPVLPRGGGTSLAGQCTARAVVIDTSSRCRAIGTPSTASSPPCVYAQAGVAIDELNNTLSRAGTAHFFAPDPATTAQATVGGCIGNNAAGSRSVKYGRTVDSVLSIDAALVNGARITLGPGAGQRDPAALKLADGVIGIVRRHEQLIRDRFPKTLRRNAGYALDMILQQLDAGATPQSISLAPLLCGSEGTLAVTLGATLRLFPVPGAKALALLSFPGVDEAIALVPAILATGPSAVELVDDVVIEAALNNLECRRYVEAFPPVDGRPATAVLYVEYQEPDAPALTARLQALRRAVGDTPAREVTDANGMADAWKLRKAGEPLLHGLPGARKPLTFVEDNAVPVERLGEFVREFRRLVQARGTRAAFWAHASVGVLHVRPYLDPRSPADQQALLEIAVETADLARRCGGVMSGEHGDGKVRGPLLERYFGPELIDAFAQVKRLFDPHRRLNPGNIVDAGPIQSILHRTRIAPRAGDTLGTGPGTAAIPAVPALNTFFDYDADEGFDHAVEKCNGAGVCRKQSGGTMCPSYRATNDERHSTRGRGNALRLAITGQLTHRADGAEDSTAARFSDPQTIATLDLCLSCKACKSECPSNVDVAKYKAEYTAQRYALTGEIPLSKRLVGHVRAINRLGSIAPGLANWANRRGPVRWLINRVMNMHPRRSMPRFSRSLYRLWPRAAARAAVAAGAPRVALFGDCFTTYNESHVGLAAARVLNALGYAVELPRAGCCGRSMISVGMLPQAAATIDATLARLRPLIDDDSVLAILVAEPSCLSAMKDDWLELKLATPIDTRRKLAAKAMLVEEFIDARWNHHPRRPEPAPPSPEGDVLLHAHCHQKALWGAETSARAVRRFAAGRCTVLPTGCCGMAGSFGYDADKFDLSMRIGNLTGNNEPAGGVLPHARALKPGDVLLATGTSCRHQVHDGAGVEAMHPIVWIDRVLNGPRAAR